jgi:predicted unusual protein kinase regulating ubiquinone biosynthesis (AarF/ABC1/UbiB family)
VLRLILRGGLRYAGGAPRLFFAAGRGREQLRADLALRTAEDVVGTLGSMKGVLVKVGQMASYLDDALSPEVRQTLSKLQQSIPPMSPELAAGVVEDELGAAPERLFARWDPQPIAAASIGQVHRAVTFAGRPVAVKVQYPGIAEIIAADLDNVLLLRRVLRATLPGQDVDALLAEVRERVLEELDYRREADNQRLFAERFRGHPTIHIPDVVDEMSTGRVLTSDLVGGARFDEAMEWSSEERSLAAETIYRFVLRGLYDMRAFNGDPHPGNYRFHGAGRVTFLDFGLVKRFSHEEMAPLENMARSMCTDRDAAAFRRALEEARILLPDAPVTTAAVVEHFTGFYETVLAPQPLTITAGYASSLVRRIFNGNSPVADYVNLPRSYVVLQRINMGLFGVLGALRATADWRAITEEIWPFTQGAPATPMGVAELRWRRAGKALVG